MDINQIIHGGAEALHRGSVDHSKPEDEQNLPRKWDHVPVWAQVWNGQENKINDDTLPEGTSLASAQRDRKSRVGNSEAIKPSAPQVVTGKVGPGGGESLTGLSPSITGYVASDATAYLLASWVFEKLQHVGKPEDMRHLELEFKFGTICDRTRNRASLPVLTETVVEPKHYYRNGMSFKSEIDAPTFKRLEDILDALDPPDPVTKSQTLQKDEQYKMPDGTNVRVSTDDRGELVEAITKKRIADIFIFSPQAPTDLRVSLSVEQPVEKVNLAELGQALHSRHKNRLSWATQGARVDLTAVNTEKDGSVATSKEAEVEVNCNLLAQYYEEFNRDNQSKAMDKFMEVLRYGLDTCRVLRRT